MPGGSPGAKKKQILAKILCIDYDFAYDLAGRVVAWRVEVHCFFGTCQSLTWFCNAFPIVLTWLYNEFLIILTWFCNAFPIALTWCCKDSPILLTIILSWSYYDLLAWFGNNFNTNLTRCVICIWYDPSFFPPLPLTPLWNPWPPSGTFELPPLWFGRALEIVPHDGNQEKDLWNHWSPLEILDSPPFEIQKFNMILWWISNSFDMICAMIFQYIWHDFVMYFP